MFTLAATANDTRRTMDALRRIVHALRATAAASERDAGVTAAQLFLLRQIAAHPGSSIGALAARARTAQSFASEVVARLVAGGLVERRVSPTDRRRVELHVTDEGHRVSARHAPTAQEKLLEGLATLAPHERHELAQSLERWIDAAGLGDAPPALFFETPTTNPG